MNEQELREIELDLLLEAVRRRHGHDFRSYARASLRRRVASKAAGLARLHPKAAGIRAWNAEEAAVAAEELKKLGSE